MKISVNGSAQANSPTDHFVLLRETSTHGFTVRHVDDGHLSAHRLRRLGIIPRSYTEQLLASQPVGTYLVRINEKIFGYALSYRASDHCRHLLIEVILSSKHEDHRLKQQHAYRFLGGAKHELFPQLNQLIEKYSVSVHENVTIDASLSLCVSFDQNTPIRTNSSDVLRYACGQIDGDKPDYADLFPDTFNDKQAESLYISLETTTSAPQASTHL